MSGPSGSSGTGTDTRGLMGGNATVYTPKGQPTADVNFGNLIQPLINDSAGGGAGTPASLAYSQALPYGDLLGQGWATLANTPGATAGDYLATAISADKTGLNYANDVLFPQARVGAGQIGTAGTGALDQAPNLYGQASDLFGQAKPLFQQSGNAFAAAPQILDMGLDPKNVQYNRDRGAALDSSHVASSMAGLDSSPYGASLDTTALTNFDSGWQDKRLKRAEDAASSYGGLLKTGGALGTEGGTLTGEGGTLTTQGGQMVGYGGNALTAGETLGAKGLTDTTAANRAPFSDLTTGVDTVIKGETNLSNLGTNKYALPQDTLKALEAYMGIGQDASRISGTLGSQGISQLSGAASGFGSALGGVGSAAKGIGSLFGGGFDPSTGAGAVGPFLDSSGGSGIDTLTSTFSDIPKIASTASMFAGS